MSNLSDELKTSCTNLTDQRVSALVQLLLRHDITKFSDFACVGFLHVISDFALLPGEELGMLQTICDRETEKWKKNNARPVVSIGFVSVNSSSAQPKSSCQNDIIRVSNQVAVSRSLAIDNVGVGPRGAAKRLKVTLTNQDEKREWIEKARLSALLGSSVKTHNSFLSGVRCYMNFADSILGLRDRELPPSVEGLLAWSTLFRCAATFSNYLGHVRLACEVLQVSTVALDNPSVKRAKRSIDKRGQFVPRKRMFIRVNVVRELVLNVLSYPAWKDAVMLFLTSYVFLLRVPSEALPICVGSGGALDGQQSTVCVEKDVVVLHLRRRKNQPLGSTLKRYCWCASCPVTCPVHTLGVYFNSLDFGAQPFSWFSAADALKCLRGFLEFLKVPEADLYRCHDLRRGHARDLQAMGKTLAEILAAGGWRSPAFLDYMDKQQLEDDVVVEAHLGDSSDEDK